MDEYTPERPFITQEKMALFSAKDRRDAAMYGATVKAAGMSNVDYKTRFREMSSSQAMKDPPGRGRIFPGYVVVRKLGTPYQYETWMSENVFEEPYEAIRKA